jgi:hypothetical protein
MRHAATLTRAANTDKRDTKLRASFFSRYTNQPSPRKHTREYVVSQLADELRLRPATVGDNVPWIKVSALAWVSQDCCDRLACTQSRPKRH